MTVALEPIITLAGLAAVMAQDNLGLKAKITHVAFGDGSGGAGYNPNNGQTGLVHEVVRAPVGGGGRVSNSEIVVEALLDSGPSFWVREIGFILEGNVLLAVWSHPTTPLAFKTAGTPLVVAYYLALQALPPEAVTIQVSGPSVQLTVLGQFAGRDRVLIDLLRSAVEQKTINLKAALKAAAAPAGVTL